LNRTLTALAAICCFTPALVADPWKDESGKGNEQYERWQEERFKEQEKRFEEEKNIAKRNASAPRIFGKSAKSLKNNIAAKATLDGEKPLALRGQRVFQWTTVLRSAVPIPR
jgi:hypothetical protein